MDLSLWTRDFLNAQLDMVDKETKATRDYEHNLWYMTLRIIKLITEVSNRVDIIHIVA